jgi:hypothetical protein
MADNQTTPTTDWQVVGRDVMPRGDLMAHSLGEACWCHPTYDDGILVHHSMDRREEYEQGRKKQ